MHLAEVAAAHWWRVLVLGAVQGMTEFLPVSSSGHLVLAERLLGLSPPGLPFEVGLHAGTLIAVAAAYRIDLAAMMSLGKPRDPEEEAGASAHPARGRRLLARLLIASIPAAVAGLALGGTVERLFGSLPAVAVAWCACGALLVLAGRLSVGRRRAEDLRLRDLFWIGALQAVALAPGFSRSGATIAAGLWRGLSGEQAARFAFLLSLPAVGGAVLLQWTAWWQAGVLSWTALAAAAVAAATGFLAIRWCAARTAALGTAGFGYYCLALGGLCLLRAVLTGEWA